VPPPALLFPTMRDSGQRKRRPAHPGIGSPTIWPLARPTLLPWSEKDNWTARRSALCCVTPGSSWHRAALGSSRPVATADEVSGRGSSVRMADPGRGRSRRVSVLDGGPDGDVADLDVVGLLDREGNGSRYRVGADADRGHPALHLLADVRIVDVVDELGADEAG